MEYITPWISQANSLARWWVSSLPDPYPMMDFKVPLLGCLFYALTLVTFWPSSEAKKRKSDSVVVKLFVFLHNIALMVFSAAVFALTFPDFVAAVKAAPSWHDFVFTAYRGEHWTLFGPFAWAFYASKFYEFMDTWIILYKGGRPSTLQVFHHIGAVITMWTAVASRCPCTWVFVIFNAFVHTVMYFYYAMTTIGFRPKLKILVTLLQIFQFFLGLFVSYGYYASEGSLTPYQTMSLSLTQTYASIVLFMFIEFAFATYSRKPEAKKKLA